MIPFLSHSYLFSFSVCGVVSVHVLICLCHFLICNVLVFLYIFLSYISIYLFFLFLNVCLFVILSLSLSLTLCVFPCMCGYSSLSLPVSLYDEYRSASVFLCLYRSVSVSLFQGGLSVRLNGSLSPV